MVRVLTVIAITTAVKAVTWNLGSLYKYQVGLLAMSQGGLVSILIVDSEANKNLQFVALLH